MSDTTLTRETIRAIDAYWAASFGCPVEALRPSRTLVLPHDAHERFNGAYAMTFGAEPIVSVPAGELSELHPTLSRWTSGTLASPATARESLGTRASDVIGPAWVGYADERTFRTSVVDSRARILEQADVGAVNALRDACAELEWDHGGSAIGHEPTAGSFANGTLAALAGFETWGECIAHIAVVAHPRFRAQGHGRAAVALVARQALSRGLVLQYRTLEANTPSRRIADSLGFIHRATSLAVRFR